MLLTRSSVAVHSVTLLIEGTKAGKVVGPKAVMIQNIKTRSGAAFIRMLKNTIELHNALYRSLFIEGSFLAISR